MSILSSTVERDMSLQRRAPRRAPPPQAHIPLHGRGEEYEPAVVERDEELAAGGSRDLHVPGGLRCRLAQGPLGDVVDEPAAQDQVPPFGSDLGDSLKRGVQHASYP